MEGRLEDYPGELAYSTVDFDYAKFEWHRIPKLILKIIELFYRKTECNLPQCANLDKKSRLTTETHVNAHFNALYGSNYLINLWKTVEKYFDPRSITSSLKQYSRTITLEYIDLCKFRYNIVPLIEN